MNDQKKIQVLQDVIRIPSVNGKEAEVASYLSKLFIDYSIESERVPYCPGRDNLVVTISTGHGKVLGLSGHMDVVSAGNESMWNYPPFEAHIEGNRLYGRGSTDMKAGLMAMVIAMIELKEEGCPFNGTIKLLATVGEEVGELGAEQLTKEGYTDDLDALIIGEPTGYVLGYAHKGSINYTVVSNGKEAHSSMPQEGYNAIRRLNDCIMVFNQKMDKVSNDYINEELGKTIHNVTIIHGGTQINSIPNNAIAQGNIRTIPEFDNGKVIALLKETVAQLNQDNLFPLELTINYNKIPVEANKNSTLIQAIQKQFDTPLPVLGGPATTDAAEFIKSQKQFDIVVFGPGVTTVPHQINEYVEISNYFEQIDIYKKIITTYLSDE